MRDCSPFTWLNGGQPLVHGVDVGHLALMVGVSAGLVAVGTPGFRRRDVAA